MATYIALIHCMDRSYRVTFPDLPGCAAMGSSLEEAIAAAKEELAIFIERAIRASKRVASPTAIDGIDRQNAILAVAIDVPADSVVERIELSVPALSLMRFDAFAKRRRFTRSGLFVEAVERWIEQESVSDQIGAGSSLTPSDGDEPVVDIEAIRRELNAPNHQDELIPNDDRRDALHDGHRDAENIKAEMIRLLEKQSGTAASEEEAGT